MTTMKALIWIVTLASGLASSAAPGDTEKAQTRSVTVKVLAARYYPKAERFLKDGHKVGAKLKVIDSAGKSKEANYLYLTEKSEIMIQGIGSFSFGGMTEKQFKRLFSSARVVTVVQSACVPGDPRLGCVESLVVAPKAASDQVSAGVSPPSF